MSLLTFHSPVFCQMKSLPRLRGSRDLGPCSSFTEWADDGLAMSSFFHVLCGTSFLAFVAFLGAGRCSCFLFILTVVTAVLLLLRHWLCPVTLVTAPVDNKEKIQAYHIATLVTLKMTAKQTLGPLKSHD